MVHTVLTGSDRDPEKTEKEREALAAQEKILKGESEEERLARYSRELAH